MSFILLSYLGFSQATPTEVLRIADSTTIMGKNLSVGKVVYNIADKLLYVTNSGVASTFSITTATGKFTLIGGDGEGLWQDDGTVVTLKEERDVSLGAYDLTADTVTATGAVMTKDISVTGTYKDKDGDVGTDGQILKSTVTGTDWVNVSETNYKMGTEIFEETGTTPISHTFGTTIQTTGVRVSLNGATLNPDSYSITDSTIILLATEVSVQEFDQVIVTFLYLTW